MSIKTYSLFIALITIAFLACTERSSAQDYLPLIPGDTSFYAGNFGWSYFAGYYAGKQIFGSRIDSIRTEGDQTRYILNRTWDDSYKCARTDGPSWLGPISLDLAMVPAAFSILIMTA